MEDIPMSFDVNPLNNNIPQLRTSKTQDGGAGHLGYFEQERKKREEEELEKSEKSIFGKQKEDTFTLSDAKEVAYVEPTFLLKVVQLIKRYFAKLFH